MLAAAPELAAGVTSALLGTRPRRGAAPAADRHPRLLGRFRAAVGRAPTTSSSRPSPSPSPAPCSSPGWADDLHRDGRAARRRRRHHHERQCMSLLQSAPRVLDPYDYGFQDDPYPVYAWLREHEAAALQRRPRPVGADAARGHRGGAADRGRLLQLVRRRDREVRLGSGRPQGDVDPRHGSAAAEAAALAGLARVHAPPGARPVPAHPGGSPTATSASAWRWAAFDWIADFAGKLPMDVISEMMGVPEADRAEVRRQADLVVHREDGVYDVPPAGAEASLWLVVLLHGDGRPAAQAADRRPHQRPDRGRRSTASGSPTTTSSPSSS